MSFTELKKHHQQLLKEVETHRGTITQLEERHKSEVDEIKERLQEEQKNISDLKQEMFSKDSKWWKLVWYKSCSISFPLVSIIEREREVGDLGEKLEKTESEK